MNLAMWFEQWRAETKDEPNRRRLLTLFDDASGTVPHTAGRVAPGTYVAGWITLEVRSALDAVGLTAAVSRALADAAISANVVAGVHHDHVFVPHDETDAAVGVLSALAAGVR